MQSKFTPLTIECIQGDSETYHFTVEQSAGIPLNLSGYTVTLTVYSAANEQTSLGSATPTDGQNGNNFAAGEIYVTLPTNLTTAIMTSMYYRLRATLGASRLTLAGGVIKPINLG